MFAAQILLDVATVASVNIQLPEFELTIDVGDGLEEDGSDEFVGVFETSAKGHRVNFYGATPEHVIGAAHLYARKLTDGSPLYNLVVDVAPEITLAQLP